MAICFPVSQFALVVCGFTEPFSFLDNGSAESCFLSSVGKLVLKSVIRLNSVRCTPRIQSYLFSALPSATPIFCQLTRILITKVIPLTKKRRSDFFFLIQNPQLSHREKSRVHSIPLQLATEIHKAQGSPSPKLAPFPSSELQTLPLHSHTSKSVRRLPGTMATFQTFPGKGAALSFSFLLYPYISVTRASPGIFKLQFIPG